MIDGVADLALGVCVGRGVPLGNAVTVTRLCCSDVVLDVDSDVDNAFDGLMVVDDDMDDAFDKEGFALVSFPSSTQNPFPFSQQLFAFLGIPQQKLPSPQGVTVELVPASVGPAPSFRFDFSSIMMSTVSMFLT